MKRKPGGLKKYNNNGLEEKPSTIIIFLTSHNNRPSAGKEIDEIRTAPQTISNDKITILLVYFTIDSTLSDRSDLSNFSYHPVNRRRINKINYKNKNQYISRSTEPFDKTDKKKNKNNKAHTLHWIHASPRHWSFFF